MSEDLGLRFDVEYEGELPDSVDRDALRRMSAVAYAFDESVRVPGTEYRIGIDPIVGVLPVAGDVVSAAASVYIMAEAAYLGVSYTTLLRMLANVTVDVVGGSLPYVGGIFDAVWKANKRNLELTIRNLAEPTDRDSGDGDSTDDTGPVEIPVEAES